MNVFCLSQCRGDFRGRAHASLESCIRRQGACVEHVVTWFAVSISRYLIAAAVSMGTVVALSLFAAITWYRNTSKTSVGNTWMHHPLFFVGAMAATLFAFRWPILLFPCEIQPDESMMIAEAMKYLRDDFIPWRSVDSGTHGPLNAYVLMLPALLGMKLDYASARMVGLFCIAGTLLFSYLTLRTVVNDALAKIAVLPLFMFYCFTCYFDFVHYSSEHVPVLLLAAAVYFLTRIVLSYEVRTDIFLAGLLLGAVPFAKLQAAPVAALLLLSGGCVLYAKNKALCIHPARPLVLYCSGAVLVPIIIIVMLIYGNAFHDFWNTYILNGIYYMNMDKYRIPFAVLLHNFAQMDFLHYIVSNALVLLSAGIAAMAYAVPPRQIIKTALTATLYLLPCMYIVFGPKRDFAHYLLFLVQPVALMTGLIMGKIAHELSERNRMNVSGAIVVVGFLSIILFQVPKEGKYYDDISARMRDAKEYFAPDPWRVIAPEESVITSMVLKKAQPVDKMAIWGSSARFFVSTGLVPGTRDMIVLNQMEESPLQDYFRNRFLVDLKAAKPKIFMDSVSSFSTTHQENDKYGHETFAELADHIGKYYTLVGSYEVKPGDSLRIYARNE